MTSFNPDRGKLRWQLQQALCPKGCLRVDVNSDATLIEARVEKVFNDAGPEKIEAARQSKIEKKNKGFENFAQIGFVEGTCRKYKVRLTFGRSDELLIFADFSGDTWPFIWRDKEYVWTSIRMLQEIIIPGLNDD